MFFRFNKKSTSSPFSKINLGFRSIAKNQTSNCLRIYFVSLSKWNLALSHFGYRTQASMCLPKLSIVFFLSLEIFRPSGLMQNWKEEP